MATIIQIKRSGDAGAPTTLALGELAYSYYSDTSAGGGRLYIGVGGVDSSGNANDIVSIGGRYFTDMLSHTKGTLTASSAIIVDADKKIDNLKVDNLDLNGNTISSTNTDGDIVLDPNGTGVVNVNVSRITNVSAPVSGSDAANKTYVDNTIDALALNVKGDSAGSTAVDLSSQTLAILGGTGLNTRRSNQTITVEIDNTGVVAGTYGSASAIPILSVNAQGQIDSAGTVAVASTLNLANDSGSTGSVSLLTQSLSITGGEGIDVALDGQYFTIIGEDASDTNKGIASFDSVNFTVTNGNVVSNDITFTTDSGSATANLGETSTIQGTSAQGIKVTGSGTTVTVTAFNATTTSKGVASFNSGDFAVSSGAVSIKAGGVDNNQLVNSSITIGTTTFNLGDTKTDVAGLTSFVVDDIQIDGNTISTNANGSLYLDPNPVGDSAGGYSGEVVIRGNLTVQGTTTTVNSTTVSINDKNIVLADSAVDANTADGAGLTIGGALYSGTKATITYDGATDRWDFNKPIDIGFASLDSAVKINGTGLLEKIEDELTTNFFLAGEGIDLTYDDNANTMVIAAETATYTNLGVASFDSAQFTLSAGYVTISTLDGGTY